MKSTYCILKIGAGDLRAGMLKSTSTPPILNHQPLRIPNRHHIEHLRRFLLVRPGPPCAMPGPVQPGLVLAHHRRHHKRNLPRLHRWVRLRRWVNPANNSQNVAMSAQGWPLADAQTVVFDNRCFPGWNPPCDDPWSWQAPINGSYAFNFTGKATLSAGNDPGEKGVSITNVTFDAATWTTAGLINLPAGAPDLVEMTFSDTQASASSPQNSGFSNLRIMQPGGDAGYTGPRQVDPRLLAALGVGIGLKAPLFRHVRYMGETGTNTQPGYYGDAGHHYLSFEDRCLPDDAIVPLGDDVRKGCWGMPWEDVIRVTQASGLGAWVNMPVSGTVSLPVNESDYAYNMALLFKNGNAATGNAGVGSAPIYIEHSNEGA